MILLLLDVVSWSLCKRKEGESWQRCGRGSGVVVASRWPGHVTSHSEVNSVLVIEGEVRGTSMVGRGWRNGEASCCRGADEEQWWQLFDVDQEHSEVVMVVDGGELSIVASLARRQAALWLRPKR